ncbi:MAG: carbon storage regulator CsrA [Armatimonadota bacterium]|nr:carbon storage regulator CsrA [Armatimonadota bacterium]MDR7392639.1 carbon storage regulator CsrA [Armatimonadota bacterium]MDR7396631.1 carbon storage regulator CsrA [Armatimonadota bacterium]MDR7399052.1 carbon storage regulator CsrA [Armatimonadota bacterium]MDR7405788.1 carbon storage regulator CsrA [Armatimonadota bacterium]
MLVLTRKPNQAVRIGPDVEVRVLEISDGQVRLGITAPRWVPVHRDEVYREIQEANLQAACTAPDDVAAARRALSKDGAGRVLQEEPHTKPQG